MDNVLAPDALKPVRDVAAHEAAEWLQQCREFQRSREFNPVEMLWLEVYRSRLARLAGVKKPRWLKPRKSAGRPQ